jgi:hypothetical protein
MEQGGNRALLGRKDGTDPFATHQAEGLRAFAATIRGDLIAKPGEANAYRPVR